MLPSPMFSSRSILPSSPLLPRALFSLSFKNNENTNPLLSRCSVLFKKEYFANSFSINSFRALLQNTGGGGIPIFGPSQALPASLLRHPFTSLCAHTNARNSILIMRLLYSSLDTRVGGYPTLRGSGIAGHELQLFFTASQMARKNQSANPAPSANPPAHPESPESSSPPPTPSLHRHASRRGSPD